MQPHTTAIFTFFVIISFLLHPLMSNPASAQEKSPESAQMLSEKETDEDFEDEEFDDGFEDEFENAEEEIFDPLSGYNSVMTEFNDGFYVYVLDPVARGYRWIMPDPARRGVKNFFHNLLFPIRFVNNCLLYTSPSPRDRQKSRMPSSA